MITERVPNEINYSSESAPKTTSKTVKELNSVEKLTTIIETKEFNTQLPNQYIDFEEKSKQSD